MAKNKKAASVNQAVQPVTTDLAVNYSTRTWNTKEADKAHSK
jgi:hypothetical protein